MLPWLRRQGAPCQNRRRKRGRREATLAVLALPLLATVTRAAAYLRRPGLVGHHAGGLESGLRACGECLGDDVAGSRARCHAICSEIGGGTSTTPSPPAPVQYLRVPSKEAEQQAASDDAALSCLPSSHCTSNGNSTPTCGCCGARLGYHYTMPSFSRNMSSYGELGAFKALAGCSDPVAANHCGTCLLWRKLRGGYTSGPLTSLPCTPLEHCFSTVDGEHTVMSTGSGIPGKDPGHFLVLPGSKTKEWAVYGIEDPVVLSAEGEQLWDVAWSAAFEPYTTIPASAGSVPHLPVAASPSDIGLGLNPASGRSMHQLHIHMARIPRPVREAFRGGGSERFKDWTQVTVELTGSRLSGQSVALYGRYYPAASFGGTVSALDPFRQVFAFSGYDAIKMQAWGMLLLPDEATSSSGVYVVVGAHHDPWDREVAWWNHYPDNPHMEGFWAAEDCPPLGMSLPEDSLAAPGKRRGAIP